MSSEETLTLSDDIAGWPPRADRLADDARPPDTSIDVIRDLLDAGAIAPTRELPGSQARAGIERASHSLIDGYVDLTVDICYSDILRFLRSTLGVGAMLRISTMEQLFNQFRRDKDKAISRLGATPQFAEQHARTLVLQFDHMYRYFFSRKGRCLFRSVALAEFLIRSDVATSIVIGVDTNPFEAHCWIQHKSIVINDTHEYVDRFHPILVV